MRTTDNPGPRATSCCAHALGMLVVVLALGLAAIAGTPGIAQAATADTLDVTQSFATSGVVPEGLDKTFSYELSRTDAVSPLPAGAEGNAYAFTIEGSQTRSLPLALDGSTSADSLSFSHAGVYSYQLRCTEDGSSVQGLSVDDSVYSIRISIENAESGGLRLGWIEIKDQTGAKPNTLSFSHSYQGSEEPAPTPTTPAQPKTVLGMKLPQTGDSLWTLLWMSAAICAGGVVLVVVGIRQMAKRRSQ